MKNILTVRDLKVKYLLVLGLVFVLAVWSNLEHLSMDNVTCLTTSGVVCTTIPFYKLEAFIAYGSIVLFALMILYGYTFNKGIKEKEVQKIQEAPKVEEIQEVQEVQEVEGCQEEQDIQEASYDSSKKNTDNTNVTASPTVIVSEKVEVEYIEQKGVRFKKDIVEYVNTHTDLSKYKSGRIVNVILEEITKRIIEGQTIDLEGFGKFEKFKVNEHARINSSTGEIIVIEAQNRIKFTIYSEFNELFTNQVPSFSKKEYIDAEKPIPKYSESKELNNTLN